MSAKRVTINDVAEAAGVSRQTVSRAINSMPEITPETRAMVLRVSEELGYRPSRFASNLARQKHHSVGLVVATLHNPYYADLASDALDVFAARGWQTAVATAQGVSDIAVVTQLARQVDAIVGYFESPGEELARAARGVPLVLIERVDTVPGLHSIALDFDHGMSDMVAQLRQRGARQFAMIDSRGANETYVPSRRRQAFENAINGQPVPIVVSEESLASAADAFAYLQRGHPAVDTVVAFNDLMAMGAMQSAHQLGLDIPGQIRIAGVDGLTLGEAMAPSLTTLSIDRAAIAETAAEIVAECLRGAVSASLSRVVRPRPVWRQSA